MILASYRCEHCWFQWERSCIYAHACDLVTIHTCELHKQTHQKIMNCCCFTSNKRHKILSAPIKNHPHHYRTSCCLHALKKREKPNILRPQRDKLRKQFSRLSVWVQQRHPLHLHMLPRRAAAAVGQRTNLTYLWCLLSATIKLSLSHSLRLEHFRGECCRSCARILLGGYWICCVYLISTNVVNKLV